VLDVERGAKGHVELFEFLWPEHSNRSFVEHGLGKCDEVVARDDTSLGEAFGGPNVNL